MKTLLLATSLILAGCSRVAVVPEDDGNQLAVVDAGINEYRNKPTPTASSISHKRIIGEPRFGVRRILDYENNVVCYINRLYDSETIACVKL